MTITCANPPVTNQIPAITLPIGPVSVPAGGQVIVLVPRAVGLWLLSVILDTPLKLQVDASLDSVSTIENPNAQGVAQWNGGLWADNINSGNAGFYSVPSNVSALRFTNSDTSAHNIAVRG